MRVCEPSREAWREVDSKLRRIAVKRGALDHEELGLIREAIVLAIWRPLGMTSIREYLEQVMGYGPTVASERVRVAEALVAMPALERALQTGELPYSAVREITRIATRKTESEWVAASRGKNLRQIEDLLAEREPGDRPDSPRKPDLALRDLRYKVRPATEADVRLAHKQLEAECGERLDEDELLHAMARAVLGPGRERAAAQIAVSVCSSCGVARQSAGGTDIALRPEEFERALCDAEWIDLSGQRPARQDVTPAVRKIVRHRDHDRCRIPGCRASTNTDVHHIVPRWAGGSHDPENLLVLCGGHHDALHRGDLRIEGPATAAVFSGTAIAQPAPAPESLDPESPRATFHVEDRPDHSSDAACTRSDALLALRTLGFTKTESLAAIESALVDLGATPPLETLVREALRRCPKP